MPEKDKGVSRSAWARVQRAGDKYSRTSIDPHSTTPTSRLWERDKAFGSRNLEIETTNDARVGERRGDLHAPAASKPRAVSGRATFPHYPSERDVKNVALEASKKREGLAGVCGAYFLGARWGTRVMGVG